MSFFSPLGLSADRRVRLCAHLTLLRRDGGDIQLGWECSDAVVLTEVDAGLVQLLEVLDGRYRVAELFTAAESMGVSAEDVTRLLRTLHAAELLEHDVVDHRSRKPGSPQTGGVRLVGLDPAGVRIGEQLLRSGIERLIVVDPTVPETSLTRRRTRAEEFRGRWGDQPGRVLVANHWSKPDGERLDLTVVVSSTLEVDRAVVTGLTHDGALICWFVREPTVPWSAPSSCLASPVASAAAICFAAGPIRAGRGCSRSYAGFPDRGTRSLSTGRRRKPPRKCSLTCRAGRRRRVQPPSNWDPETGLGHAGPGRPIPPAGVVGCLTQNGDRVVGDQNGGSTTNPGVSGYMKDRRDG